LHWGKWKEENTQAIWADPDDDSKKMSQHKYWQKHIWPNLPKTEKEKYEKLAKDARSDVKKIETKNGTATKRGASKSGYQVFLEKMKELIDKDQEFTHPETGETVKLHHYLIYVWKTYIKPNKDLNEPFESMAKSIRESDEDTYDLNDLPYLDVDKLIAGDLEDLELINN
jgi:hypothetical protein